MRPELPLPNSKGNAWWLVSKLPYLWTLFPSLNGEILPGAVLSLYDNKATSPSFTHQTGIAHFAIRGRWFLMNQRY
ncbi:MAG: hypothetical protein ACI965_000011 [Paraglaciecola sp.]|jgi:hypothetical protein